MILLPVPLLRCHRDPGRQLGGRNAKIAGADYGRVLSLTRKRQGLLYGYTKDLRAYYSVQCYRYGFHGQLCPKEILLKELCPHSLLFPAIVQGNLRVISDRARARRDDYKGHRECYSIR